jgi:hypothetical protein
MAPNILPNVDVHIAHRPIITIPEDMKSIYKNWQIECYKTLNLPNINIYTVNDDTPYSAIHLRTRGYSLGNSEYVSHVNDDDLIIGDPFTKCCEILDANPSIIGVYVNSYIDDGHNPYKPFYVHTKWSREFHLTTARPVHELCVMRRTVVEKSLDKIDKFLKTSKDGNKISIAEGEQLVYAASASFGDWLFLPQTFGYIWRKHNIGRHRLTFNSRLCVPQRTNVRQILMKPDI